VELIAVFVLAIIMVLGGAVFVVFLQFLAATRKNQRLYQRIIEEISALGRQVDGLSRTSELEGGSDRID